MYMNEEFLRKLWEWDFICFIIISYFCLLRCPWVVNIFSIYINVQLLCITSVAHQLVNCLLKRKKWVQIFTYMVNDVVRRHIYNFKHIRFVNI